jgi:hypothetical protein
MWDNQRQNGAGKNNESHKRNPSNQDGLEKTPPATNSHERKDATNQSEGNIPSDWKCGVHRMPNK